MLFRDYLLSLYFMIITPFIFSLYLEFNYMYHYILYCTYFTPLLFLSLLMIEKWFLYLSYFILYSLLLAPPLFMIFLLHIVVFLSCSWPPSPFPLPPIFSLILNLFFVISPTRYLSYNIFLFPTQRSKTNISLHWMEKKKKTFIFLWNGSEVVCLVAQLHCLLHKNQRFLITE